MIKIKTHTHEFIKNWLNLNKLCGLYWYHFYGFDIINHFLGKSNSISPVFWPYSPWDCRVRHDWINSLNSISKNQNAHTLSYKMPVLELYSKSQMHISQWKWFILIFLLFILIFIVSTFIKTVILNLNEIKVQQ